jgi:hypothetical protein
MNTFKRLFTNLTYYQKQKKKKKSAKVLSINSLKLISKILILALKNKLFTNSLLFILQELIPQETL